jgi:hypothetical protein
VSPLRLLVYDRTAGALATAWWAGKALYRGLGRLDAGFGAASWAEALEWLGSHGAGAPLAEVQFWGHGRWGLARIGSEALDVAAVLDDRHPHRARLRRVAERLLPGDQGLWWFRTCETFGTEAGQRFARAWTRALGCRAAGHTYVIGVWQSGLHSLLPGEEPPWSPDEGLRPPGPDGRAASLARTSGPRAPNTITCFHGKVPPGF